MDENGESLPFSSAEWFRTASGKGELVPVPEFVAAAESRSGVVSEYPLEFLPRKADNYMNSTFANQAVHQRMEAGTAAVLEMHAEDAAARGVAAGDAVEVFNGRGRMMLKAKLERQGGPGRGGGAAGLGEARRRSLGRGGECECADERAGDGYWGRSYVLLDAGGGAEGAWR